MPAAKLRIALDGPLEIGQGERLLAHRLVERSRGGSNASARLGRRLDRLVVLAEGGLVFLLGLMPAAGLAAGVGTRSRSRRLVVTKTEDITTEAATGRATSATRSSRPRPLGVSVRS